MRACVIFKLKNDSDLSRVGQDVPNLLGAMKRNVQSDEMVFRSNDGLLFGFFVETNKPLAVIKREIVGTTGFINGDSIIIYEVGPGLEGTGFSRAWTWLQHHPAK